MTARAVKEGELLWQPSSTLVRSCRLTAYMEWLRRERRLSFRDYSELHAFSTQDISGFWRSLWDYFDLLGEVPAGEVVSGTMPDAHWFPGARLNYAEHALQRTDEHPALIYRSETGQRLELSYRELGREVARVRSGLAELGVTAGDRVAALLSNRPEAVIGLLATASLGAIWSSCSPDFGAESVLDRFRQIGPKVLLAQPSYDYGGRAFDRRAELAKIRAALPTLTASILLGKAEDSWLSFSEIGSAGAPLTFEPVEFEHPLWILYSSGTTGLPKAIVHGHGGILLEHLKVLALHSNLGPADRFLWFTTTGWMMWNYLVSGLLLGSTLVLYDGSPAHPNLSALFQLAEEERLTYLGTSAPFLLACQKAKLEPKLRHDLSALKSIGTTGAPLPASGFAWVYQNVASDVLLGSLSGGTDVCTAFVLSCPILPVHAGEIQCAGLGAQVEAYDSDGHVLDREVGELVITQPLPSMPIRFWNDPGSIRRIDSYFSTFPGVWRHGDWIKRTAHQGFVIYGRSDATLNRGGVRMGSSEFYSAIEAMPEISDSLVIDTGSLEDASGKLWLFVVLSEGVSLDRDLEKSIRDRLRSTLSPRHVPDEIRGVAGIPRTLNGKKLEVPVKRILLGAPPESAVAPGTLADATALIPFIDLARELAAERNG